MSDVHIVIAFVAIFLFPLTLGLTIIRFAEDRDTLRNVANAASLQSNEVIQGENSPAPAEDSYLFKFVLMIFCFIVSGIFISFFFCYNKIWLLYLSTFNFMQFALVFAVYIFDDDERISLQVTFVTSIIAFSVLVSHYDVCKTEKSPDSFVTIIRTNDTIYNTSSQLLYLGKTNNYIFVYDVSNKESRSIKSELVKEIVVKRKE